ncbi:dihydrolipoamide acetyltransferase family protein [Microbacterium sp. RD1]|uniref:dihydrolipoamide acetyltransferase family protein n=1 Tax=Microbacterium sp. RD1 TaxID=3457313 RepID=UPI003FA5DE4B
MATVVRMPVALAGVTESAVQTWLVQPGQALHRGDPLAEIETDKAVVEFAADADGTLARLLIEEGVSVDVGTPIAVLLGEGEDDSHLQRALAEAGVREPARGGAERTDAKPLPAEVPARGTSRERIPASPLVRRLARSEGIALDEVEGTGPAGRITRRDLERHVSARPGEPTDASRTPVSPAAPVASVERGTDIPVTGMRRAIARRLVESKSTVPQFSLTRHCRVDALLELRRRVKESSTAGVSVNDFVVKAAALALAAVPEANTIRQGETMRRLDSADIAVAVAIDSGLVTPVVRGADRLSLRGIAGVVADLADRARAGRLQQHELEGGSFTISNLGMYGVDEFAAIVNPPHAGILAVGAATPRAVVVNGQVSPATMMTVTLSGDHRVIDEVVGARWLAEFVALVESPLRLLI